MDSPAQAPIDLSTPEIPRQGAERRAFAGFFLIGVLMAIPGAALPAWDYHLQPPYASIGLHFLCFAAGVVFALRTSGIVLLRLGAHRLLAASFLVAAMGIVLVEFSAPPSPEISRHFALGLIGLAQGGIMAATVQLLRRLYEREAAATVNLAGGLMGLGAFLTALLGALSYGWMEFEGLFILLALAPFGAAFWFFRRGLPMDSEVLDLGFQKVLKDIWSPMHVLFAALLFFETAAEVSVLEWVPLHLILKSGMSPASAMYFLSYYCLALLAGRFIGQALITRFARRRLLLVSAGLSWVGVLTFGGADNSWGALLGLTMTAMGFSFVYPLLVERVGNRFKEFHSNLFHGIFGLGMVGGILAPAVIAFWANVSTETSAMTVPLLCSLMVFVLLLLLWVEAKISGLQARRS